MQLVKPVDQSTNAFTGTIIVDLSYSYTLMLSKSNHIRKSTLIQLLIALK